MWVGARKVGGYDGSIEGRRVDSSRAKWQRAEGRVEGGLGRKYKKDGCMMEEEQASKNNEQGAEDETGRANIRSIHLQ